MNEYNHWYKKAEDDLDVAKYNLKGNKIEAGLFFLQQSSEKALKSLYIKKFKKLIRTHDLVLIAREVKAPEEIISLCKQLTPLYQFTRYPDASPIDNLNELSTKLTNYTEEILKWVKKKLKE